MREKPASQNYIVQVKSEMTGTEDCDMREDQNFRMLAMVDVAAPDGPERYQKKLEALNPEAASPCPMKFLHRGISDIYVKLMRGLQLLDPMSADELLELAKRLPQAEMWVRSSINAHTPLEAAVAVVIGEEFGSETGSRCVEMLVSRGAPLLLVNDSSVVGGRSSGPLHMLCAKGDFERVQRIFVVAQAAGRLAGDAADGGEVDAVQTLFSPPADGISPARAAVNNGHGMKLLQSSLVREMCHNIDAASTDYYRAAIWQTSLSQRAASLGVIATSQDDLVAMFAEMCRNDVDAYCGTVLGRAMEGGAASSIPAKHGRLLVERLPEELVAKRDLGGRTCLNSAISAGNVEMVKAILARVPRLAAVNAADVRLDLSEAFLKELIEKRRGAFLVKYRSSINFAKRADFPLQQALRCASKRVGGKAGCEEVAGAVLDAWESAAEEVQALDPELVTAMFEDALVDAVTKKLSGGLVGRLLGKCSGGRGAVSVPARAIKAAIIADNRSFLTEHCARGGGRGEATLDVDISDRVWYENDMPGDNDSVVRGSGARAVRGGGDAASGSSAQRRVCGIDRNCGANTVLTPVMLALQRHEFDMAMFLINECGASIAPEFIGEAFFANTLAVPDRRMALISYDGREEGDDTTLEQYRKLARPYHLSRFLMCFHGTEDAERRGQASPRGNNKSRSLVMGGGGGGGGSSGSTPSTPRAMLLYLLDNTRGLAECPTQQRFHLFHQYLASEFATCAGEGEEDLTSRVASALAVNTEYFTSEMSLKEASQKDLNTVDVDKWLWNHLLAPGSTFTGWASMPRATLEKCLERVGRGRGFGDEGQEEPDAEEGAGDRARALVMDDDDSMLFVNKGSKGVLGGLLFSSFHPQLRTDGYASSHCFSPRGRSGAALRARLLELWPRFGGSSNTNNYRDGIVTIFGRSASAAFFESNGENDNGIMKELCDKAAGDATSPTNCITGIQSAEVATMFLTTFAQSIARTKGCAETVTSSQAPWMRLVRFAYDPGFARALVTNLFPKLSKGDSEVEGVLKEILASYCLARGPHSSAADGTGSYTEALAQLVDEEGALADTNPNFRRRLAACSAAAQNGWFIKHFGSKFGPAAGGGEADPARFVELVVKSWEEEHTNPMYVAVVKGDKSWPKRSWRDKGPFKADRKFAGRVGAQTQTMNFGDLAVVVQHTSAHSSNNGAGELIQQALIGGFRNIFSDAASADSNGNGIMTLSYFWQRLCALCIAVSQSSYAKALAEQNKAPPFIEFLLDEGTAQLPAFTAADSATAAQFRTRMWMLVVQAVLGAAPNAAALPLLAKYTHRCADDAVTHQEAWERALFDDGMSGTKSFMAGAEKPDAANAGDEDDSEYCEDCNDAPPYAWGPGQALVAQAGSVRLRTASYFAGGIAQAKSFRREFNFSLEDAAKTWERDVLPGVLANGQPLDPVAVLGSWGRLSCAAQLKIIDALKSGHATSGGEEWKTLVGDSSKLVSFTDDDGNVHALRSNTLANQLLSRAFNVSENGVIRNKHVAFALLEFALGDPISENTPETLLPAVADEVEAVLRDCAGMGNRAAMRFINAHRAVLAAQPIDMWGDKNDAVLRKVRVHPSVMLYDPESLCSDEEIWRADEGACADPEGEEEEDGDYSEKPPVVESIPVSSYRNDFAAAIHAARCRELGITGSDNAVNTQLSPAEMENVLCSRIEGGDAAPSLCSSANLQQRQRAMQLGVGWQMRVFGSATPEDVVEYGGFPEDQAEDIILGRMRFEFASGSAAAAGCYADCSWDSNERQFVIKVHELADDGNSAGFVALSPQLQRLYDRIISPKLFNKYLQSPLKNPVL